MNKSSVVHFEMPYKDAKRVSGFYNSVFGWDMNNAGESMGNYIVAETTETDSNTTRPKNPGAINGGFYPASDTANPYPSFVIAVEDINKAIEDVKAKGGEIIGEVQDIPGVGLWISFKDTEGNRVSILQPKM